MNSRSRKTSKFTTRGPAAVDACDGSGQSGYTLSLPLSKLRVSFSEFKIICGGANFPVAYIPKTRKSGPSGAAWDCAVVCPTHSTLSLFLSGAPPVEVEFAREMHSSREAVCRCHICLPEEKRLRMNAERVCVDVCIRRLLACSSRLRTLSVVYVQVIQRCDPGR